MVSYIIPPLVPPIDNPRRDPFAQGPSNTPMVHKEGVGRFFAERTDTLTININGNTRSYDNLRTHASVDLLVPSHQDANGNTVFEETYVYASYYGRVVQSTGEWIGILHYPVQNNLLTRYVHLTQRFVQVDEDVTTGQIICMVGGNGGDHLHFQLLYVSNQNSSAGSLWSPHNSVAIDPTPYLYRWEVEAFTNSPNSTMWWITNKKVLAIHYIVRGRMPFVAVDLEGENQPVHIPLYQARKEDMELLSLLKDGFLNRKKINLAYRNSMFWGRRVVAQLTIRP